MSTGLFKIKLKIPPGFPATGPIKNVPKRPQLCNMKSRQIGGTCWFHSVINGFLLSNMGRALMRKRLHEYKMKYGNSLASYNNSTCPKYGELEKGRLMYYIDHFFQHRKPFFSSGNRKRHNAVINNLRRRKSVRGGTSKDVARIIRAVFGRGTVNYMQDNIYGRRNVSANNMNAEFFLWNMKYEYEIKIPPVTFPGPVIFATITAQVGRVDHVVTGVTCGNTRYIYDSNDEKLHKVDWVGENRVKNIRDYFEKNYGGNNYKRNTPIELDYVVKV